MTHMEGEQVMFRDITLVYKTKKKKKDALAEERRKNGSSVLTTDCAQW